MTAKPVTLRAVASRDIDEIVEHYLREAGSAVAFGFIDALEQACAHLAGHPATGSLRHAHELNLPGQSHPPRRLRRAGPSQPPPRGTHGSVA